MALRGDITELQQQIDLAVEMLGGSTMPDRVSALEARMDDLEARVTALEPPADTPTTTRKGKAS